MSVNLKQNVAERARYCCEYCRSQEAFSPAAFSVEHITPHARGGNDEIENLAYACQECNNRKFTSVEASDPVSGESVPLYHPRQHTWSEHFAWNEDYTLLIGLTPTGRATIERLKLNRDRVVNLRDALRQIGRHPLK